MTLSRGQQTNAEIATYIKARNSLIQISSTEELRVERGLTEVAALLGCKIRFWDCATQITEYYSGGDVKLKGTMVPVRDDGQTSSYGLPVLDYIKRTTDNCIYVLRDLNKWFGDPITLRGLKSLAKELRSVPLSQARTIIILTSETDIPRDLKPLPLIDYPLPDRSEVAQILKDVINQTVKSLEGQALVFEKDRGNPVEAEKLRTKARYIGDESFKVFDTAVDAAVGLTAEEAGNCFARSMVSFSRIEPKAILQEKKNIISQIKGLSWYDRDPRGLDGIGGLDLLKAWISLRKVAFTPEAREANLPILKGLFLAGISGTGKSLAAKCIGTAWDMPVLRLDFGALQEMYVGNSQKNIRNALKVVEAIGNCVLWADEIEKALAGSQGPAGDGGVASDQLGYFLTWSQEKTCPACIVATCNDPRKLPPEFMRKGRFDEVFWLDLPNSKERLEILKVALKEYSQDLGDQDLTSIINATDKFIGAEIAALVPEAMFVAFADGKRKITVEDLTNAANGVIPLSKTQEKVMTELRAWADGRAKRASSKEEEIRGVNMDNRELNMAGVV